MQNVWSSSAVKGMACFSVFHEQGQHPACPAQQGNWLPWSVSGYAASALKP
jgi:hypothetical protein